MLWYMVMSLAVMLALGAEAPSEGIGAAGDTEVPIGAGIPAAMVEAGRDVIRSSAGEQFTECCIRFDPDRSELWRTGHGELRYTLGFRILMPELDIDSRSIRFTLDQSGQLVELPSPQGIPDCLTLADACRPRIGRTRALAIAQGDYHARAWGDWSEEFLWREGHGFVWEIGQRSSTHPGGLGSWYLTLWTVDAQSGEVLDSRWAIMAANRC